MKKTITAILALTLSAALFTGCTAAAMNAGDNTASGVAPAGSPSSVSAGIAGNAGSETYIDQSDAESIALTDAGLTSDTVKSLRSRLEYDDGVAIYDVEFWTDTDEYDYEIDAVSGEILAVDRDVESYTPSATAASDATTSGVAPQGDPITEDAARQAALTHAGLTDDGSIQYYRCELDRDDGQCHYDVEFCHNGTEYDYEIDAYTGEVHSYDHETEYHHHQYGSGQGNAYGNGYGGSTSATITADEAKAIAFQHAGVNEADATRVKVDLDEDDGRLEYDVEWEIGTVDYDRRYYTDPAQLPLESQTAVGALRDHLAICGGYSLALQLLYEKAGIPCYTVSGTFGSENHMWNLALLDGEWLWFDATTDRGLPEGAERRHFAQTELESRQSITGETLRSLEALLGAAL